MKIVALGLLVSTVAFAGPEEDNEASFKKALAKQKLAPIALKLELKEQSTEQPAQTPGHIDLQGVGGWKASTIEFVANDKHELFLVERAPKVTAKLTIQLGCPQSHFAGGRAWFEHLRFAIPAGYTYRGATKIEYAITQVDRVEATKQPDGTPCPDVPWAMD